MKIAILSNINMDYVARLLKNKNLVFENEGYGNEIGVMLNQNSAYNLFAAEYTFLIIDIIEIVKHNYDIENTQNLINEWFDSFILFKKKNCIYYVSNAYLVGKELDLVDYEIKEKLCRIWNERLISVCEHNSNVQIFDIFKLLVVNGIRNMISYKTWYMGKIIFNKYGSEILSEEIQKYLDTDIYVRKKVLIIDLDNTIWGGLAGETDNTPIILSDEKYGLCYKDAQRIIKLMKSKGVLLAACSKNNQNDAFQLFENHKHMVLGFDDFVKMKINWQPKFKNIIEIAEELNLNLDSFVFIDDNPVERDLIKKMLPSVVVPEFPDNPEEIPNLFINVYKQYFENQSIAKEDAEKTKKYIENEKRNSLKKQIDDYDAYLQKLEIVITPVNPEVNVIRLMQIISKTNQFNLTTKRYTTQEFSNLLEKKDYKVFAYKVSDRFGDNGIVAIVIIKFCNEKTAVIEEFAMSCRTMGLSIEYAILEDVESSLLKAGIEKLIGLYIPTSKNTPVSSFYKNAGYLETKKEHEYFHDLKKDRKLNYKVTFNKIEEF